MQANLCRPGIRSAAAGVGTFLDVLRMLGEGEEGFHGGGKPSALEMMAIARHHHSATFDLHFIGHLIINEIKKQRSSVVHPRGL